MSGNLRVIIVDDDVTLTDCLEVSLSVKYGMTVVGVAKEGHEALEILKKVDADIALVDLQMEGMDGFELLSVIRREYPLMKTLVLTVFYNEKFITDAIKNGANGYILKGSNLETIKAAIENVMAGRALISDEAWERLAGYINGRSASNKKSVFDKLTPRELEICSLKAKGYSNKQIVQTMSLQPESVNNYISSIYKKTGIRDMEKIAELYIQTFGP